MDATDLSTLSDGAYSDLVARNLSPKVRDAAVWEQLTDPDNMERTRSALLSLSQHAADTLRRRKAERDETHKECLGRGAAGRQEWFATKAEFEQRRRNVARFHQKVLAAISEITKLSKDRNRSDNRRNIDASRQTLRKLAVAVHRHQAAHAKAGVIAEQADYELWQLLDQLTVPVGPDGEPTSLRVMLDFFWTDVDSQTEAAQRQAAAERGMRQAPAGRSAEFSGKPRARHVGNDKGLADPPV